MMETQNAKIPSFYKDAILADPWKSAQTLAAVFAWIGIFYAFFYIFKQVSVLNFSWGPPIALIISAAICSLSTLGVLAFLVLRKPSGVIVPCILLVCVAADITLNRSIISYGAETPEAEYALTLEKEKAAYPGNDSLIHHLAGINLSLLGIALCGGLLVSGIIKKPSYLIPLSLIAGIADVWSVSFGVTKQIAVSRTAANYVLLNFPVAGQGIQPLIGAADFLFSAMYIDLSRRFNLSLKRTISVLIFSLLFSITIAVFIGKGVPVLPVMAVFFILAHYDHIRIVDPQEKREAVKGTVIVLVLLAAATLLFKLSGG
ncbi:MAG: hypothetical protein JRF27_03645 [Deltaproteobacteria bacterium]|nr:hypothetical protein [Deltaproteobacteria bacterium]